MKNLLYFKYADIAAQLLALLGPLVWGAIKADVSFAFLCYLTLGTVQITSCLLNKTFLPQTQRNKSRHNYEDLLLILFLALLVIGIFVTIVIFFSSLALGFLLNVVGYILAILSAIMGLWYIWLSYKEIKNI